jgi:hypothetical protein
MHSSKAGGSGAGPSPAADAALQVQPPGTAAHHASSHVFAYCCTAALTQYRPSICSSGQSGSAQSCASGFYPADFQRCLKALNRALKPALLPDLQERFSEQELDAAYRQLASQGLVAVSGRRAGVYQLSDRFLASLQVTSRPSRDSTSRSYAFMGGRHLHCQRPAS